MNQTPKGEARTELQHLRDDVLDILNRWDKDNCYDLDTCIRHLRAALAQSRTPEPGPELSMSMFANREDYERALNAFPGSFHPAGAVAEAAQPEPPYMRVVMKDGILEGYLTARSGEAVQRAAGEDRAAEVRRALQFRFGTEVGRVITEIERAAAGKDFSPQALSSAVVILRAIAASETPPEALRPDGKEET